MGMHFHFGVERSFVIDIGPHRLLKRCICLWENIGKRRHLPACYVPLPEGMVCLGNDHLAKNMSPKPCWMMINQQIHDVSTINILNIFENHDGQQPPETFPIWSPRKNHKFPTWFWVAHWRFRFLSLDWIEIKPGDQTPGLIPGHMGFPSTSILDSCRMYLNVCCTTIYIIWNYQIINITSPFFFKFKNNACDKCGARARTGTSMFEALGSNRKFQREPSGR